MIDKYVKTTYNVDLSGVAKDLRKLPLHIKRKLYDWIKSIDEVGIFETRNQRGFRDEHLKGKRSGQRSIRLSRAYRVIYELDELEKTVVVLEVNKHEY